MNKVLIGLVASLAATVAQAAPTQVTLTNPGFEDVSDLTALSQGVGFRGVNGWQKKTGTCKTTDYKTWRNTNGAGSADKYHGAIGANTTENCALYQTSVPIKQDATYRMSVDVCSSSSAAGGYMVGIGLDQAGNPPVLLAIKSGTTPSSGSCETVEVEWKAISVSPGNTVALYLGNVKSTGPGQVEFDDVTLTEEEAVVIDPDSDDDGTPDSRDNCPLVSNADQADLDGDGVGDECDPDKDGDGVANGADNCPLDANATQADADYDGIGDACDSQFDAGSVAGYLDGQAAQAAAAIEAANVPGGTGMVALLDGIGLALDQALNAYLAGQISAEVYQGRLSMLLNRTVAFDNQVNAKERSRHLDSATANALRTVAQNMRDAINAMLANP